MGRRTYDTLPGPLPDRTNVIVTRDRQYRREGVTIVHSLSEAIDLAQGEDEVFVAGGGEIYREALRFAERIYLTVVHACPEGDVYFPELEAGEWRLTAEGEHAADERHAHPFSFRLYERRR